MSSYTCRGFRHREHAFDRPMVFRIGNLAFWFDGRRLVFDMIEGKAARGKDRKRGVQQAAEPERTRTSRDIDGVPGQVTR